MKPKLLLADTKGARGHVGLYRDQIASVRDEYEVTLCGPGWFVDDFKSLGINLCALPEVKVPSPSRVARAYAQLSAMLRCYAMFNEGGFVRLEFLAYDNIPMAIASRLFKRDSVWICDHNNVDRALSERLQGLAFRSLSKVVGHIALEAYIADFLVQEFGFRAVHRQHPLRTIEVEGWAPGLNGAGVAWGRPYVFCPSRDCDGAFLHRLYRYCQENGLDLIARRREAAPHGPGVYYFDHFAAYDQLLVGAEFVAIGVNYRFRVSGVFYEALANRKRMILNDCQFTRTVAGRADNAVWL